MGLRLGDIAVSIIVGAPSESSEADREGLCVD